MWCARSSTVFCTRNRSKIYISWHEQHSQQPYWCTIISQKVDWTNHFYSEQTTAEHFFLSLSWFRKLFRLRIRHLSFNSFKEIRQKKIEIKIKSFHENQWQIFEWSAWTWMDLMYLWLLTIRICFNMNDNWLIHFTVYIRTSTISNSKHILITFNVLNAHKMRLKLRKKNSSNKASNKLSSKFVRIRQSVRHIRCMNIWPDKQVKIIQTRRR